MLSKSDPARLALLMFAWKMTRPVNLFALCSGLPLVGLGSFAVQTSIVNQIIVAHWPSVEKPKFLLPDSRTQR